MWQPRDLIRPPVSESIRNEYWNGHKAAVHGQLAPGKCADGQEQGSNCSNDISQVKHSRSYDIMLEHEANAEYSQRTPETNKQDQRQPKDSEDKYEGLTLGFGPRRSHSSCGGSGC